MPAGDAPEATAPPTWNAPEASTGRMSFKGDQGAQNGKKKAKKASGGSQTAHKGDGTVRSVDGAADRAGDHDVEDLLGGE